MIKRTVDNMTLPATIALLHAAGNGPAITSFGTAEEVCGTDVLCCIGGKEACSGSARAGPVPAALN